MKPTDDELEAMAAETDRRFHWTNDAFFQGVGTMLRACKAGDAPDHAEWDAAIEAAAKKAERRFEQCERDNTPPCYLRKCFIGGVLRTLKKGQTND